MILIYFLGGIYALIAAFCIAMTLREQKNAEHVTFGDRVLGVMAGLFWPLSLVAVAVAVQRRSALPSARAD